MSTLSAERKSLDADLSNEAAAENAVATFACGIALNVRGLQEIRTTSDSQHASIRVLLDVDGKPA
jgi:hypothetical protein